MRARNNPLVQQAPPSASGPLKRSQESADMASVMRSLRDRTDLEPQLAAARARIADLESRLAQLDSRDPLAGGLLTLKAFRTQLELDVQRSHRYRRPLSVAMLDVDGFRVVNAEHGYRAGDELLGLVGEAIARHTRVHDLACRTGGDEFAVLLPETGAEAAVQAMNRLLREIEDIQPGSAASTSASVGVAPLQDGQSPEQLLAAAREALEQARAIGGGQVSVHAPTEERAAYSTSGHGDVVAALASALQERDRYTGDHSESVVDVAGRVAESLGLSDDEVGRIRTAALLHDIGKVGVPDEILHKSGPLDPREWEVMRQHPVTGERILRAIPGMGRVAKIVRHEHERFDGGGYPDGLSGADIPIGARIILACDAYHAMTSDRPYRKAMSHTDAVAELTRHAGTQFDPEVVQALVGYLYGRRQAGTLTL